MNYYKIKYPNGDFVIDKAESSIDIVRKYDLATRENINTRIVQLEGEQLAIAQANEQETKIMDTTINRLTNHVQAIADSLTKPELDACEWFLNDAKVKSWCCETHRYDGTSEWPGTGEHPEHCDSEPSAMDWLEDVLDIRYVVNSDGEFISARVLVAFGGPDIWVNFETNTVEGTWGMESATAKFTDTLDVEGALAELWESK